MLARPPTGTCPFSKPGAALRSAELACHNHKNAFLQRVRTTDSLVYSSRPDPRSSFDLLRAHAAAPRKTRPPMPQKQLTTDMDDVHSPPEQFHVDLQRQLSQANLSLSRTPSVPLIKGKPYDSLSPFAWGETGDLSSTHRQSFSSFGTGLRTQAFKPKHNLVSAGQTDTPTLFRSMSHDTFTGMQGRPTESKRPHNSGPTPPWRGENADNSYAALTTTQKTAFCEHLGARQLAPFRPRNLLDWSSDEPTPDRSSGTTHGVMFREFAVNRTPPFRQKPNPSPFADNDFTPESTSRATFTGVQGRLTESKRPHNSGPTPPWRGENADDSYATLTTTSKTAF